MSQPFRLEHIQRPAQFAAIRLLCLAWQEYWSLPTIKRKRRIFREELHAVETTATLYVPSLQSAIDYQVKMRSAITTENINNAKQHIDSLKDSLSQLKQFKT